MNTRSSRRKGLKFYLRICVSIFLLFFVLRRVGLMELWATFREADLKYVILSLIISPVLIFISSWKWYVILRAQKIRVSLLRLFWLYTVGFFFNTVLPTNVGGDVVRAYALGKSTGKNTEAFSSVFLERFTGVSVLLFMAILAFIMAIRDLWDIWLSILLIVCLIGYFSLLIIILNPTIFQWIKKKMRIGFIVHVLTKLQKFQNAILAFRKKTTVLSFALANSFLFYFVAVMNVYVSALAFHAKITILDAFIITPIVLVITMIPISLGGIGLSEGAYYFIFSKLGLPGAIGLSAALLIRAKALLVGLIGGLYYSITGIQVEKMAVSHSSLDEKSEANSEGSGELF